MIHMSSKYRLLCVTLLAGGACLTAQAEPQLVDKIVAVAGNHPILHSEAQAKVTSGPLGYRLRLPCHSQCESQATCHQ